MADTMRTVSALQTLLADNTAGNISPQDMRDVLESLRQRGGAIYISSAVETVVAAINTPLKALGTTTLVTPAYDFSMPANNRLRYDGAADVLATINCGISITSASSNQDTTMYVALNGTVIASSAGQRKIGTGADTGRAAISAQVVMSSTDYVEAWIENNTGSANITFQNMTMSITAGVV